MCTVWRPDEAGSVQRGEGRNAHEIPLAHAVERCDGEVRDGMFLDGSTLYTMQYIESSTIEKLYTFNVKPEVLEKLGRVMGRLMKLYVDKEFKSLEILETLL